MTDPFSTPLLMPPLPVPNLPLLRKCVEWAEAEATRTDGRWVQSSFATQTDCGTAYCVAGYAVSVQPGYSQIVRPAPTACDCSSCSALPPFFEVDPLIDGVPVDFYTDGRRLLGLTREESLRLFSASNTITEVRRYAEAIADRAGERL